MTTTTIPGSIETLAREVLLAAGESPERCYNNNATTTHTGLGGVQEHGHGDDCGDNVNDNNNLGALQRLEELLEISVTDTSRILDT
jgi:hypothetical protein